MGVAKAVLLGELKKTPLNLPTFPTPNSVVIKRSGRRIDQMVSFFSHFTGIWMHLVISIQHWIEAKLQDDMNLHLMRDFSKINMELQYHLHILCSVGTIIMFSFHPISHPFVWPLSLRLFQHTWKEHTPKRNLYQQAIFRDSKNIIGEQGIADWVWGMGTSLPNCRYLLWASFSRPGRLNKCVQAVTKTLVAWVILGIILPSYMWIIKKPL